jgi:hypothetical protein
MTTLVKDQKRTFHKDITFEGIRCSMKVEVRHDDCCGNGCNTFSITGSIRGRDIEMGGCIHEEIAKYFPELQHLIKWHNCGTDKPLHYFDNTIYHAGDRDAWGLRKGQTNASGRVGEGKERQLDFARLTAIWPEATDDELMADDLRGRLENRLPALLAEFQRDIEAFGFTF